MTDRQKICELLKSQKGSVNLNSFPNLLVLGPQSTASSWMHKNLSKHPQIFMSKTKELFFFCEDVLIQYIGREEQFDLKSYMHHFKTTYSGSWIRLARKPIIIGEATD